MVNKHLIVLIHNQWSHKNINYWKILQFIWTNTFVLNVQLNNKLESSHVKVEMLQQCINILKHILAVSAAFKLSNAIPNLPSHPFIFF